LREAAADPDGREVLRIHLEAGDRRELGPEILDDLVGRRPLVAWLQAHEDASGVRNDIDRGGADGRHDLVDVGLLQDDRGRRSLPVGGGVSDTQPDTRAAAGIRAASSWRSRPTTPPMKSTGMNAAASVSVIERMVKPISLAPARAASSRPWPSSMWRTMFSSITTASSTTKPTHRVRAISEMMSIV